MEEKDNKILELFDQLRQAQALHEKYVDEKEKEISNIKEEFQLELDQNNDFVLDQINSLKQELNERRLVYIMLHIDMKFCHATCCTQF